MLSVLLTNSTHMNIPFVNSPSSAHQQFCGILRLDDVDSSTLCWGPSAKSNLVEPWEGERTGRECASQGRGQRFGRPSCSSMRGLFVGRTRYCGFRRSCLASEARPLRYDPRGPYLLQPLMRSRLRSSEDDSSKRPFLGGRLVLQRIAGQPICRCELTP